MKRAENPPVSYFAVSLFSGYAAKVGKALEGVFIS